MSTQLFFRTGNNDYSTGNDDARLDGSTGAWDQFHGMLTTRGPSFVARATNTVAGPTNGVEVSDANGNPAVWYSPPLDADVTISGSITWNLRAAETNMTDNVAINGRIEVIDGATGAITLIDQTARVTELATAEAANNFAETPAAGVACKRGDRLRVRIFGDDAGTMGAGGSFTFWFNGPTAAASGDSYLTLTENLTFAAEPAGTQIFPTDSTGIGETVLDTGFVAGITYENVDRGGLVDWVNPSNASASDDVYATNANLGSGTDYLVCRNLGLSIPAGSVIRGVWVSVEGKTTLASDPSVKVQLQDDTATLVGSAGSITISNGESVQHAGGAEDALGATLTKAIVESSNFGVRLWSTSTFVETLSIDQITVKVYYQSQGVYQNREAWTSRGAGVVNDSVVPVTGWTAPLQFRDGVALPPVEWYTRPLAAFTLGGAVRCNISAKENSVADNAAVRAEIAIVDSDGSNPVVWATATFATALTASEAAQSFLISGDDISVADGKRLRIRVYLDDSAAAAMVTSVNGSVLYYAGTSGGASGDTFLTFTQTLTELPYKPSPLTTGPSQATQRAASW